MVLDYDTWCGQKFSHGILIEHYKLGSFYMEGDAIWSLKWTSNILENYYQNIQKIFGQFYEDIFR
jgi:hypothetical protein